MTKPLSPHDVHIAKKDVIPDQVIEAFNELIAENYTNGKAVILQTDAVNRICEKMGLEDDATRIVYDKGWLNVEELYRSEGWAVKYDSPVAWGGEDFEAYFEFRKTISS